MLVWKKNNLLSIIVDVSASTGAFVVEFVFWLEKD